MSDPLWEVYRRKADTEIGKQVYDYQKAQLWYQAYGSMYFSMREGEEFSILENVVRQEG